MPTNVSAVEAAMAEAERLHRVLKKSKASQVRATDERALAKATAGAWFANHQPVVSATIASPALLATDAAYMAILEASEKHGARSKYNSTLGALKTDLIQLRRDCLAAKPSMATSDQPPDFSPLIADPQMQAILVERWKECHLCVGVKASLSATVMMGGLLEALLLARINRETDKKALFTAKAAPKVPKSTTAKPLGEWMLNDFITVLAEVKWITVSAGAVGIVLRDYRNYIHPQKQLTNNVHLTPEDAILFWEVTKSITRQVIGSVK